MSLANDNLITDVGIPIATQVTGVAFFLALVQCICGAENLVIAGRLRKGAARRLCGKHSFRKQGNWDMEEGESWQQGN
jgi:hypothetical protein